MAKRKAKVVNSNGIHCRPSAVIVGKAKNYNGSIKVSSNNCEADLKSVIGLIGLGLEVDTEIDIEVNGPDEESFADKLVELFETHFDFPPRN